MCATVREWRRLGLSYFCEKAPDIDTRTRKCQYLEDNSGRTRQEHIDAEGPASGEPPRFRQGPGCRPREAKGELTITGMEADTDTWRGVQG